MSVQCLTLWIGGPLGPVERACLRSVLRQGHQLALYCYREPAAVPDGVDIRDASAILPQSAIFHHRSGSVAFFADWFRYELQLRGLGTWLDTDVYLLAPLDGDRPHLFGLQEPGKINNAILRLPPQSPILPKLLSPFRDSTTPPWLGWWPYLRSRAGELARGKADLSRLPWGSTGPNALSAVARELGLESEALPSEVLYPVPWRKAGWILDPALRLEDVVTPRSVALHLWNERIRSFKDAPAPEGSFLHRLQMEGRFR